MRLKYDLHIHSTMSPCSDDLMTPNNILNMAYLMNLDIISVTDHNDITHQALFCELAKSYDFIYIPGVEIALEGFDVLCYFKSIKAIEAFMYELSLRNKSKNRCTENLYARRYNLHDDHIQDLYNIVEEFDVSYSDLYNMAKRYKGLIIPAHIDRKSKSIISRYSLNDIKFDAIELTFEDYSKTLVDQEYKVVKNSDSHTLMSIGENQSHLNLANKDFESFFRWFNDE